jgi:hypothetical protein
LAALLTGVTATLLLLARLLILATLLLLTGLLVLPALLLATLVRIVHDVPLGWC